MRTNIILVFFKWRIQQSPRFGKDRDQIEDLTNRSPSLQMIKIRPCNSYRIDEVLCEWFKIQRSHNIPTSGSILQAKANDFDRLLE